MFENDETPEGGEFHEVNGRRYSIVGNKVYVDGLFGWKLVEKTDEQAEAGDRREANGSTYSLVGDTVYRKNWLGGWDEVSDSNEKAEAGDLHETNGSTYSSVGNTIYRKGLFGWETVTDENEEAEAGDVRKRNNTTYSLVSDSVYRKDVFGWTLVEDDDECAEAGDHYVRNNDTYSMIGNVVYKKELFGWRKLNEEINKPQYDASPARSSAPYRNTQRRSDSDEGDTSGWWIKWLVYIALFIGAIWLAFAIVLPLIIINAALVLFICGAVWKDYRKLFYAASLAGLVYLLLDIHFKGLTASLADRAAFFETVINAGVYVNMLASLIAVYLLVRTPPTPGTNEFSKPNIILLSALVLAGVVLVFVRLFIVGEVAAGMAASPQINTVSTATTPAPEPARTAASPALPPVAFPATDPAKTDSSKVVDNSATAALQPDTNQMKSNLIGNIGNVQYTDQLFNVGEIKAFNILNRNNYATGISFLVDLELTKNRSGEVEMNYNFNNQGLSLAAIRLVKMDIDVAIPADQWVQFRAVVGFNMRLLDDSQMYWKAFTDGQVYETGADIGPVTLPSSNSYLVKSRDAGPLMVRVEFTPNN